MHPLHILRAAADAISNRTATWSAKHWARHELILKTATGLIAQYGRSKLSFTSLARAMAIGSQTLSFHFVSLDALLAEILRQHLQTLYDAIAAIPDNTPNLLATRRMEYADLIRTPEGPTHAHQIWLQDRATLPPDLLAPLQELHQAVAALLTPATLKPQAQADLLLLMDCPALTPATREKHLAIILDDPENHLPAAREAKPPPRPRPVAIKPAWISADADLLQMRRMPHPPDLMEHLPRYARRE